MWIRDHFDRLVNSDCVAAFTIEEAGPESHHTMKRTTKQWYVMGRMPGTDYKPILTEFFTDKDEAKIRLKIIQEAIEAGKAFLDLT